MYFFSDSYREGRDKFGTVCRRAGLEIESHINPHAASPTGDELAMDVVWCGPEEATKVLLVTCGTHGLEAAPGSATILQWVSSGACRQLPNDTAVMIVHGVNAYGWAHSSRTNEDNIDVNRNFLDHSEPHPKNPAFEELHEQIIGDDISSCGLDTSIRKYHAFARQHGANTAIHGITGGQYTRPDGVGYGGTEPSWSSKTLLQLVRKRLASARKVVVIDWHTGIGDFAEPFFIIRDAKGTEHFDRAVDWWGRKYVHRDDIFDSAGSPDYAGLLLDGLKREIQTLNGADVLVTAVEWGTYGLDSMLQALLIDRWLRFVDNDPQGDSSVVSRSRLVERFYPSMPEWRRAVLEQSERIYRQSIDGLEAW